MPAPGLSSQGDLLAVLHPARTVGTTTRAHLGLSLGLGRSVVAQRVGALMDLGLVEEGDARSSSGGRAPRELRFRGEAGLILVGELGASTLSTGICDLAGTLLAHSSEPADVARGPEPVLAQVQQAWSGHLEAAGAAPERIWGAGLGLPGPIEFATGRPISPPVMPGWDGYPVREQLADAFRAPVWVDNEVNLEALGEARWGLGRDVRDLVFVKLSTGIGSGVISGGVLHRGAQGAAGDIGHMAVVDDVTAICRCGNTGCLETVAGGGAIARAATARAGEERSTLLRPMVDAGRVLTAEDVLTAATRGDPLAIELLTQAGRLIGETLSLLVNFYNPGLLVLGGALAQNSDIVLSSLRETVYGRSLPLATRNLVLGRSELGATGGLLGAAAMIVDELLHPWRFYDWATAGTPHGKPEIASSS